MGSEAPPDAVHIITAATWLCRIIADMRKRTVTQCRCLSARLSSCDEAATLLSWIRGVRADIRWVGRQEYQS